MNAVFKRELRAYFSSPMGYVFVGIFMLVLGLVFLIGNINGDGYNSNANFAMTLGTMATPFAFLVPLLTMRSFSEERRLKIDQLYLTSPLPIYKVVLGKFFAASCVLLITLLLSVIYPIILAVLGSPRDVYKRQDLVHRLPDQPWHYLRSLRKARHDIFRQSQSRIVSRRLQAEFCQAG